MRVILLAGGKGTRLHPYTVAVPKPLVPVGDLPILEVVLQQLKICGATEVTISIGHLGEIIRAFVGDGSKFGVKVSYLEEASPLGTAGPLRLLGDLPERFILMNGDVLTDLDYSEFLAQHSRSGAEILIASHRKELPINLGVLRCRDGLLQEYLEKPVESFEVSMGVYAMSRSVVELIPEGRPFDFPDLIQSLLRGGRTVRSRVHDGLWLDIGTPEDCVRAQELFTSQRERFLPGGGRRSPK